MLPYIKIVAHIFPLFFLGPQLLKIHICKKKKLHCAIFHSNTHLENWHGYL